MSYISRVDWKQISSKKFDELSKQDGVESFSDGTRFDVGFSSSIHGVVETGQVIVMKLMLNGVVVNCFENRFYHLAKLIKESNLNVRQIEFLEKFTDIEDSFHEPINDSVYKKFTGNTDIMNYVADIKQLKELQIVFLADDGNKNYFFLLAGGS
jgi:hypothetical protein